MEPQIVVVDLGGQRTAQKIRELGVRSVVLSPQIAGEMLATQDYKPKGIILSSGWEQIYCADAPEIPKSILDAGVPILGIATGMQWLAQTLGGVIRRYSKEYGFRTFICVAASDPLFSGIPERSMVRMSHEDSVAVLPCGAYRSGMTIHCGIASFTIPNKKICAIQFHPEDPETQYGAEILKNFLLICNAVPDWDPACIVKGICANVRSELSKKAKVLHLMSGGVASTVLAKILYPVLRERLICIVIDTGDMDRNEIIHIRRNLVAAGCSFEIVDARQECAGASGNLTDEAQKRLALQLKTLYQIRYVMQGTLAKNLIGSEQERGIIPVDVLHDTECKTLNPLINFSKDEIRDIARFLKLPEFVVSA